MPSCCGLGRFAKGSGQRSAEVTPAGDGIGNAYRYQRALIRGEDVTIIYVVRA
jgi:hypothetical protein